MDETPLEHVVVALATKCTREATVLFVAGEETETPANTVVVNKRIGQRKHFITLRQSIQTVKSA